ncbi:uncharacterized protein EV420DRAFT_1480288 [Desarmillaria tabescens]|uniref:Uncharacterized protein n=1 Tax=Armillaria tabescens TaxID=1929756 RepID=A0AA39KD25_ARMTA|nr:uncharacterized protein EV420DRAFT_1480288 [Desarmillaria tabescens]KAK0457631.1 hypothetical protein EV420DRAFT_1480288 [Desarmillaria tabescens]
MGKLMHQDGTLIRRFGNETFLEVIQQTMMQSNLISINMMKAFLDDEIDYFEEDVDIAYLDEESKDDCTQLYAAAQENEAQIRELPVEPTKAVTTNPYGTRMNPNKNIISDDPGIHEQNVRQESLPPLNPIVKVSSTTFDNKKKQIIKELQYRTFKAAESQELAKSTYLESFEDELARVNLNMAHELNKQYPIMPLKEIRCSDANGNQGTLLRQFNNVYLRQANIVTNVVFFFQWMNE